MKTLGWVLWAIFGNDKDGMWGQRSGEPGYDGKSFSIWLWICWQARNPCHELFHTVLRKPPGEGWFISVPRCFYIGYRPDSGAFGAALFRGYGE
jgi:hypothetical protein